MKESVSKEAIQNRFGRLLDLQYQIMHNNAQQFKGTIVEVIAEGPSKTNELMMSGRTKTNKLVNFSGNCNIGDTVNVQITDALTFHLTGTIIS